MRQLVWMESPIRASIFCLIVPLASGCDYIGSYVAAPSAPKIVSVDDTKEGPTFTAIVPRWVVYESEVSGLVGFVLLFLVVCRAG